MTYYSGSIADYTISKQADGTYSIVDHRTGLNDGADVLKTIEYAQFADRTIALESTTNSAPTSISLDDTSIEASAKPGALVGHLSGVDPDGDALGYFIVAENTIHLSSKSFDRLAKGVLSEKAFHVGAKAHDRSDRISFNDETGGLSYDADGSGKKYAAIKFAQLDAKTFLQADDFFIA